MDDILTLIGETPKVQDENGIWRGSPSNRDVYCRKHDITRAEFFGAGRNGLSPEFMVTVFATDYHGERKCKFHEEQYNIYRTFRGETSDYIELYCERTAGTN